MIDRDESCKRAALSACERLSGVPAESGAQRAILWGGGLAPMRWQTGRLSSVGNAASVRDERRVACETSGSVI